MKILGKIQRRATIWILGAFRTLPTEGLKAIAGLIPIKFHLQKLASRSQLHSAALLENHLIRTLMDDPHNAHNKPTPHSINKLTKHQKTIVKGYLIDSNNKLLGIFPSFSLLNLELNPGSRIVDIFSDQFSFNLVNREESNKTRFQQLDKMTLHSSSSPHIAIVITDTSVKNDITISVSHIHICDHPLIKTVHHTAFVTSTEAELFAIRCSINQAYSKENISKIIVVTNSIHVAKKIFDNKSHLYQIYMTAILRELWQFFTTSQENSIEFWECPSHLNWRLHQSVDKDLKSFNPQPILLSKLSCDYCKKIDSDNIINLWKMTFQVLDGKCRHFLNLFDDSCEDIKSSYIKGSPWFQSFSHSNSLCAQATRAITNHAPIGEYCLQFFPNEEFKCPCSNYPIETRRHILYECTCHNGYWNPRRDLLSHFIMFLIANPRAFAFINNIQPDSPS